MKTGVLMVAGGKVGSIKSARWYAKKLLGFSRPLNKEILPRTLLLFLLSSLGPRANNAYGCIDLDVFTGAAAVLRPASYQLKDLNGYFPFRVPDSLEMWYWRRRWLQQRIQTVLGLWPELPRVPLRPVIHGRVEFGDYAVEKVFFESLPGFYVTGNLYRPLGKKGPFPAVLSPHGHWAEGRFHEEGEDAVRREIATGAERFEENARNPIQARCVHLARMGYVVFNYDMIGYADSIQIPASVAHGFRKQRPEMNDPKNWGFFSPQAELWFESIMGLQTWNSIRALDFLLALPDVDRTRLAVTGASGGGTQTFILCAIDPRPTVAFPAVMVSTEMQGGCTCENACGLRIDTSNVEIAALFAPRPLGMTAANDWTVNMPTRGFPELQRIYGMFGASDRVALFSFPQFGHNYNAVSRAAMYGWIQRWLQPGEPVPEERTYHRLTAKELTVWDEEHSAPRSGPDVERAVCQWWTEQSKRALEHHWSDVKSFFETYLTGWQVIVGRRWSEVGVISWRPVKSVLVNGTRLEIGILRNETYAEEHPAVLVRTADLPNGVVVLVTACGKRGVLNHEGTAIRDEVMEAIERGWWVVTADLFEQGELRTSEGPYERVELVPNGREALAYTYGYNHSPFARRVHGVMSLIRWAEQLTQTMKPIVLVGCDGGGKWAAVASSVIPGQISCLLVDSGGFRFADITDIRDPDLLPGAVKFGDLPGAIATGLPGRVFLAGEDKLEPIIKRAVELKSPRARVLLVREINRLVIRSALSGE